MSPRRDRPLGIRGDSELATLTELFPFACVSGFRRRLSHGRLPALVLSVRGVVAFGVAGADPISVRVAAFIALPPGWDRRPRSAGPRLGRSNAPRAAAECSVSFLPNLKTGRNRRYRPNYGGPLLFRRPPALALGLPSEEQGDHTKRVNEPMGQNPHPQLAS